MSFNLKDGGYIMSKDWDSRNAAMERKSQAARQASKQDRCLALQEKLNVGSQGSWAGHCTNVALQSRITDIKKLQATFEKCLKAVREEGSLMMRTLQRAEHAQDDLHHILDIVRGCLTLRNEKQSKELVNDEPHREIQQIQSQVNGTIHFLLSLSSGAQKHLQKLHDLKQDLENAIHCQDESLQVDSSQLQLEANSAGISLKLDPLRQQRGTMSKPVWEQRILDFLTTVDDHLRQCRLLRDDIGHGLVRVRHDVSSKCDSFLYALRKRIHTQQQSINQLEWQENYLIRELETLSKTLSEIECFRNDIQNPMKLAQTRLEGRNERCSAELCFDDAQQTLHNEVEVWNAAQNAIRQRLTNSRQRANELEDHLEEVKQDLRNKRISLGIDKQCLEISKRICDLPVCKPVDSDEQTLKLPIPYQDSVF